VGKIKELFISVLKQGLSAHKMALAISMASVVGIFPLWGTTTIINGFVAIKLRLNMLVVQVVNYLVYPAQFLLLIPEIQLAHFLFYPQTELVSLEMFIEAASQFNSHFLHEFGFYIFLSILGWLVISLPSAFLLYFLVRMVYFARKMVNKP